MAASQLPVNFAIPSEGSIASYNWTDLANGVGYETYYCYLDNNATPNYVLTSKQLTADTYISTYTGASYRKFISSVLNLPKKVKGSAIVTLKHFGEPSTSNGTYTVEVFYTRNSVETSICTAITSGTVTGTADKSIILTIPLTTTNLKKGDTITVGVVYSGNNGRSYMNSPPITAYLPFDIDN